MRIREIPDLDPNDHVVFCDWVDTGKKDETGRQLFVAKPRTTDRLVTLTSALAFALGFTENYDPADPAGGSNTLPLRKLIRAGFVDGVPHVSPNRYLISLASFYAYCRRVCEDPDFWTEARRELYRTQY